MNWITLIVSLPTSPSAARVRTWRALRATGCVALRDGVYLLPERADCAAAFARLAASVQEAQGSASVLSVVARDAAQQAAFTALFDRRGDYAALAAELARARRPLRKAAEPAARKTLRALAQRLDALRAIDFFPSVAAETTAAAFDALRAEVETRRSPGEPAARAAARLPRLDAADYRGRVWATRRRPWVDRLASAWLIRRCIDRDARIVWIASPDKAPKRALGFDYDGAAFTHVGDKVTFEVLATRFALDGDEALRRVGEVVHAIDVGGAPSAEAAGLEAVIRGLQAQHKDDDTLLAAACAVFDALYAGFGEDGT